MDLSRNPLSPYLHGLKSPTFKAGEPACAAYEPELWWGNRQDSPGVLAALNICHRCPVQVECLEHALSNPETEGIWGGTLPLERKRAIRTRAKEVA